ncbi:hypothetical protein KP509_37G029700 [Ceratopteris richardii]|uniref:Uncharacterized protein n=1 Tax=Ceratopteris richardii TaxID=49495 RepID=A0A8T2Q7G7_CERRI|nr:hypothetical protein KP509_37G029700 [Ceratopteris richardii]
MASVKVVPVCLIIFTMLVLACCMRSQAATSYERNVEAAGDAMNLDQAKYYHGGYYGGRHGDYGRGHGIYYGRHDGYYGRRRGGGYYGGRGRYRGGHGLP